MANSTRSNDIAEQAAQAYQGKRLKKLLGLIAGAIFIFLTIMYVTSVMYTRFGSFTIKINKYQQIEYGLSLSEDVNFAKSTSLLNCQANADITNVDGHSLLQNTQFGETGGAQMDEHYLSYTFYLKNSGSEAVNYEYSILITRMSSDVDKAVRLYTMSYYTDSETGESTAYSGGIYARSNGVNRETGKPIPEAAPAPFTLDELGYDEQGNQIKIPFYTIDENHQELEVQNFVSNNVVLDEAVSNFKPNDVMKYTIVLWLEGNDPECTDDIIGGEFKIDMKFSVTGVAGSDEDI